MIAVAVDCAAVNLTAVNTHNIRLVDVNLDTRLGVLLSKRYGAITLLM